MHEHTPRHNAPVQGSSDRSFGLVFTTFFLIIGLLPLLHQHAIRVWALGLSAVILVISLAAPALLAPANKLWTKFGALLHSIISPIALGVLFFAVVTPIGLLMKLLGKDPLRLRFDKVATSYWIVRTPPGPDADSLNNQF